MSWRRRRFLWQWSQLRELVWVFAAQEWTISNGAERVATGLQPLDEFRLRWLLTRVCRKSASDFVAAATGRRLIDDE